MGSETKRIWHSPLPGLQQAWLMWLVMSLWKCQVRKSRDMSHTTVSKCPSWLTVRTEEGLLKAPEEMSRLQMVTGDLNLCFGT